MGRTEDIKFSPNDRRLAVACFAKNQIAIFDLCLAGNGGIILHDVTEISSLYLKSPHGVDFIDDERIIVANREGDIAVFELPRGGNGYCYQIDPVALLTSNPLMYSPGAVSVTKRNRDTCDVLICNNYGDRVTRHIIDCRGGLCFKSEEILLSKWLSFPDAVAANGSWIAISNHGFRNVLLYDNVIPLNENTQPDGILRCICRPHGVRFTSDGWFILVADYETPYVHIYKKDELGWRGVRNPVKSVKVMSDDDFLRGLCGPRREGGAKGIDTDNSLTTLVTTSELQPLAFFDLATILSDMDEACVRKEQISFQIEYELEYSRNDFNALQRQLAELQNSRSWRITAPLRWANSFLTSNKPPSD